MKKVIIAGLTLLIIFQSFGQTRDYTTLHNMLIQFYGYQRAGLKGGDAHNLNPKWSTASHSGDSYKGNQLDGGWYDAGDYIKFGMPLGYAVYCLLKGYDVFPTAYADNYSGSYGAKDGIPDILNEVKVATDYLIKAVIDSNTIIRDVGNAAKEHQGLDEPILSECADGRTDAEGWVYTCTGADIPAVYAACLALMSTCYKKYDSTYAKTCLEKAKVAFRFAKKKVEQGGENNLYCSYQTKNNKPLYYYANVDDEVARVVNDKLVAAGVELYRASNSSDPNYGKYKEWAKFSITNVFNCIGYTLIGPLASFEVWRQSLGEVTSLVKNLEFITGKIQTSGTFKDVFKNSGSGTAREAGSAAFTFALGYVITSDTTKRNTYKKHVENHIGWIAGYTGARSYVVGFNNSPADNIHYRSSAKSQKGPKGALVSGPDDAGNWENDRSFEYCEVAIDFNAGVTGAVAFLKAISNPGDEVLIKTALSADPKVADFGSGTVKLTATLSKSVKWELNIEGGFGQKKYTGEGSSISQTWDGSADNGLFLTGETVIAKLTIDGDIASFDLVKAKPFSITISKAKAPATSPSDSLVDNFEDGDMNNKYLGKWTTFGSETGYKETFASMVNDKDGSGTKAIKFECVIPDNSDTTYGGIKAPFNSGATAVSIGSAKSIIFDMHCSPNKATNVTVELEQSNITDRAYYSLTVPVLPQANKYRLNFSDFRQPEWKKSVVALDPNKIASVRFTLYDSTGMIQVYLDNIYIEDLKINSSNVKQKPLNSALSGLNPTISNGAIRYQIFRQLNGAVRLSIYNIAGKLVLQKQFPAIAGTGLISLSSLPAGIYTLIHSVNGNIAGEKINFTHIK